MENLIAYKDFNRETAFVPERKLRVPEVTMPVTKAEAVMRSQEIPPGLIKKPAGMAPGQYKKLIEENSYEHIYQAMTPYLDPEGLLRASGISQSGVVEKILSPQKMENMINRNIVLTVKGYHPAKVPHPILTHFIKR